jgi:hypothetical protein
MSTATMTVDYMPHVEAGAITVVRAAISFLGIRATMYSIEQDSKKSSNPRSVRILAEESSQRRSYAASLTNLSLKNKKMIRNFLTIFVLQLAIAFGSLLKPSIVGAQTPPGGGFKVRENNVHAPNLYADNIDFIATLVNLPGAKKKQSYWELSYQLFFIPEEKYYEAVRRLPRGGSRPSPEHFDGRILLAEGHKKKTRLGTLKERTITLNGVAFKEKVPDALRTKFALLMTGYSLKIFDAELNTTVYRSGIFLTEPYEANPQDQKQEIARKTIYLNFMVTPDGMLNYSQAARTTSDIRWK